MATISELETLINGQLIGQPANITAVKRRTIDNAIVSILSNYESRLAALELQGSGGSGLTTYTQDNVFYMENDTFRVGISLTFGAVISYFGDLEGNNMVNIADAGRYNGGSVYSNPEDYSVPGYDETPYYPDMSWNIVQAGDAFNNPSPVQVGWNFNPATKTFYAKVIPMQYKFDGLVDTQAQIEVYYTFMEVEKAVKCRYVTNVNRPGENHTGRSNETPHFYFTRDLQYGKTYAQTAPFTNAATETLNFQYDADGGTDNWAIFPPDIEGDIHNKEYQEYWVWLCNNLSTPTKKVGIINIANERWSVKRSGNVGDGVLPTSNPCMIVQHAKSYHDTGVFSLEDIAYLVYGTEAETRALAYALNQ